MPKGQRRYVEVAVGVCAAVPRADGKAQGRLHRRAVAGDRDRAKVASKNPRSTVGTVTEIYDYLRVLYARVGMPHCHQCGAPIGSQTGEQMVDRVLQLEPGTRFMVLAPVVSTRKGEYREIFAEARAEGFSRARVDGEVRDLQSEIKLNRKVKHSIEIVVDRLQMPSSEQQPDVEVVGLAEARTELWCRGQRGDRRAARSS